MRKFEASDNVPNLQFKIESLGSETTNKLM